ncbi:MAG: CbtA family protein [Methylococcales bacterium]|nr:CbtA family protein [Methylococcales bacterium]
MYFRNFVLSAFVIALVAGLFLSLYQHFLIAPIIIASEVYEVLEPVEKGVVEAWNPEDGLQRSSFSFGANFLVCFAYALLLLSAMAARDSIKITQGLLWGLAAYFSIFAAPSFGLSPEIPGMEAAHLEGRQTWWLLTVFMSMIGLWLIAFNTLLFKGLGIVLLVIPHLIGAPQPETHGFVNTNPEAIQTLTQLWHDFILQTHLANGFLWLIIGVLAAGLSIKFILPLNNQLME